MIALALSLLLVAGCYADGPCAKARDDFQKTGMVGQIFSCDADGFYTPIQCEGSVCHCSDAVGTKLGFDVTDTFSIGESANKLAHCTSISERPCYKDRANYKKKGIIGLQFRCTETGFYNQIQCRGSVCYCSDLYGKVFKGGEFSIGDMSNTELLAKRISKCNFLQNLDFWKQMEGSA